MVITGNTVFKIENTETKNIKILQKKLGIKIDGFYGPVTVTHSKRKTKIINRQFLELIAVGEWNIFQSNYI